MTSQNNDANAKYDLAYSLYLDGHEEAVNALDEIINKHSTQMAPGKFAHVLLLKYYISFRTGADPGPIKLKEILHHLGNESDHGFRRVLLMRVLQRLLNYYPNEAWILEEIFQGIDATLPCKSNNDLSDIYSSAAWTACLLYEAPKALKYARIAMDLAEGELEIANAFYILYTPLVDRFYSDGLTYSEFEEDSIKVRATAKRKIPQRMYFSVCAAVYARMNRMDESDKFRTLLCGNESGPIENWVDIIRCISMLNGGDIANAKSIADKVKCNQNVLIQRDKALLDAIVRALSNGEGAQNVDTATIIESPRQPHITENHSLLLELKLTALKIRQSIQETRLQIT